MERFILDFILLEDRYDETKDQLKNRILANFSERKTEAEIVLPDGTFKCNLGQVLLNLILVKPFRSLKVCPKLEEIYKDTSVTQGKLEAFFNRVILTYQKYSEDGYDTARQEIVETLDELSELSGVTNILAGNSLSFHDFVRLEAENPEAREFFRPKFEKNMQFNEIEKKFNDTGKALINFFASHPDTELHPYAVSKTGLNAKQLAQCIGFVGLKPDIDGSIIPVNIQRNYLVGLGNLENYFINCKGTRKALITNFKAVRKSGYLTRKLSLCMMDTFHDNEIEDCGTTHFIKYKIENSDKLRLVNGRHYYRINENGDKISEDIFTIDKDRDSALIGKTIGLRSPVTCAGKHICATCYGKVLSEKNKNLNTGLVAVLRLTEPLTQTLLSAKHLLTTRSEAVNWGQEFLDIFAVNMNEIYFNDIECTIKFPIPSSEEYDEDEEMFIVNEFEISESGSKKITHYKSPVKLLLNPKFLKKSDDDEEKSVSINSTDVSEDDFVFKFQVGNSELTESLQEIIDLIETSTHLGLTDYNDVVNKFSDLLIANGLGHIMSVHTEMIVSQLVKDEETGDRPDFSKDVIGAYVINRVSKSVMDGPLSTSLAFERLNDQFSDLKTYKKEKKSIMDDLFR